jgi:hypothetical protein
VPAYEFIDQMANSRDERRAARYERDLQRVIRISLTRT